MTKNVARMKRSEIRGRTTTSRRIPDCASLHPGYACFAMTESKEPLVVSGDFLYGLGTFYAGWTFVELLVTWALGKFLSLPHEETHILTSGMEFGKAANLLRQIVGRSDHENRSAILASLDRLQND